MPLFDSYTQKLLLELTKKPRRSRTGKLTRSTGTSTFLGATGGPATVAAGGGGVGPGALPSGPAAPSSVFPGFAGTAPAAGTMMPPGSDIFSQGAWSTVKRMVDPVIDHYSDMIPVIGRDPLFKAGAKQFVKAELASRYLGGAGMLSPATFAPAGAGSAMSALAGTTMIHGALSSLIGSMPATAIAGAAGVPTGRFGRLGMEVSKKIPGLMAMGIDPLDWATKAFGADAAYSHMANIGSQTATSAIGAGGYLERGKRKGIF